jgi:hypothetical protein
MEKYIDLIINFYSNSIELAVIHGVLLFMLTGVLFTDLTTRSGRINMRINYALLAALLLAGTIVFESERRNAISMMDQLAQENAELVAQCPDGIPPAEAKKESFIHKLKHKIKDFF